MASGFKKVGQHPLRHTWLHRHDAELGIEVHDALHAAEIDDHAAVARWQCRAIAPVVAGADGIDGDAMRIGDTQHFGHRGAVHEMERCGNHTLIPCGVSAVESLGLLCVQDALGPEEL